MKSFRPKFNCISSKAPLAIKHKTSTLKCAIAGLLCTNNLMIMLGGLILTYDRIVFRAMMYGDLILFISRPHDSVVKMGIIVLTAQLA